MIINIEVTYAALEYYNYAVEEKVVNLIFLA